MSAALRCELFPEDLDEAVRFYTGVLGFEVVRDERGSPEPYVALQRDRVHLGLARRAGVPDLHQRRPPVGVELVLEVEDVADARQRVAAGGWPVVEDMVVRPWGLEDFRLLDPAGYYWRVTTAG